MAERSVSFWQCVQEGAKSAVVWPEDSYLNALRAFGRLTAEERTIGGVCHIAHPGGDGLTLSMHKPLDRNFLAHVDWSSGTLKEGRVAMVGTLTTRTRRQYTSTHGLGLSRWQLSTGPRRGKVRLSD